MYGRKYLNSKKRSQFVIKLRSLFARMLPECLWAYRPQTLRQSLKDEETDKFPHTTLLFLLCYW